MLDLQYWWLRALTYRSTVLVPASLEITFFFLIFFYWGVKYKWTQHFYHPKNFPLLLPSQRCPCPSSAFGLLSASVSLVCLGLAVHGTVQHARLLTVRLTHDVSGNSTSFLFFFSSAVFICMIIWLLLCWRTLYLCFQFLYTLCFEDCCGHSCECLGEHPYVFLSAVERLTHKTGRKLRLTWTLSFLKNTISYFNFYNISRLVKGITIMILKLKWLIIILLLLLFAPWSACLWWSSPRLLLRL